MSCRDPASHVSKRRMARQDLRRWPGFTGLNSSFQSATTSNPHTKECGIHKRVKTRNITLSLPVDLIREAKVYAAQHDTTINAFVKDLLQEALSAESRARAAG